MRKIFYILPILFSLLMTSCDDEQTVVQLKNETSGLTVSAISPQRGYQEALVTIVGSNFGVSEEFVKVFFGDSEQAAKVISCEDGQLVVKVPEGAKSGAITLEILDQRIVTSNISFTVVPDPVITGLSQDRVYGGDEITVSGNNFGTVKKDVQLYCVINGEKTLFEVKSCSEEEVTAEVPVTSIFGEFDLKIEILGREAHSSQKITLLEKATISGIKSDSKMLNGKFAFAGDKVTVTGTAFGNDKSAVAVKIGDLDAASIESCTENEIIVVVPTGFTGGKITVTKDGLSTVSKEELKVLTDGTDISDGALVDPKNPESVTLSPAQIGTKKALGIPKNWIYTPNMINKKNAGATERVGLLEFHEDTGNIFTIGAGWGYDPEPTDEVTPNDNYIRNGKMYQKTTLPAGNYTLEINVLGHGHSGSELHYIVSKASGAFPNYNAIAGNNLVIASKQDVVNGSDAGAYQLSFGFTLNEETEVYIGVAVNFNKNLWYNFEGFKLTYNHGN